MSTEAVAARLGPMVDANVHLWDQATNPVFWLSDRTMVVEMLGDYSSLPDSYTLDDYLRTTDPFEVRGVIWSDAGAADPVRAADWVRRQDTDGRLAGIVTLGDPLVPGFRDFVDQIAKERLVTSVRVRLTPALQHDRPTGSRAISATPLLDGFRLLARAGLVATIETSADQLDQIATLAGELPDLRIVLDHFGWPDDLSPAGHEHHLERLGAVAAHPNVATRLDALGTIFGSWDVETVRPWIVGVVAMFGCDRCMVGSDLPIETLRTSFADLCHAYDEIFSSRSAGARRQLFHDTAMHWLGTRSTS